MRGWNSCRRNGDLIIRPSNGWQSSNSRCAGWSLAQTARTFWLRKQRFVAGFAASMNKGPTHWLRSQPVNKFPEFVHYLGVPLASPVRRWAR